MRAFAEAAREDATTPYILIIDEMNRANLAKVLSEPYFLLECRDQTVRQQYPPTEDFILPENLFIIGTMNTAGRSIARIDTAMRRRFAFIELDPASRPCRDCSPAGSRPGISPARGPLRPLGDIDVLILGDPDRDQLFIGLSDAESCLGRPVDATIREPGWL